MFPSQYSDTEVLGVAPETTLHSSPIVESLHQSGSLPVDGSWPVVVMRRGSG